MFTKLVIKDQEGKPYLTRWVLFRCRWFKIYLHKLDQDDKDRDLHDHPWNFVSLILRGGYREFGIRAMLPDSSDKIHYILETKNKRFLNIKKAETPHRVALLRYPTWTLLLAGRERRTWGFWTAEGWKSHQEYLGITKAETSDYD